MVAGALVAAVSLGVWTNSRLNMNSNSIYSDTKSKNAEPETSSEKDDQSSEQDSNGDEKPAKFDGAYNPETGEINFDCPCLGDMPHGPCGPQFREAFACFIYSDQEPKGIDCVEKFKGMQECFKEHPEVYGDEIMDDDDDEEPLTTPDDKANDTIETIKEEEPPVPSRNKNERPKEAKPVKQKS